IVTSDDVDGGLVCPEAGLPAGDTVTCTQSVIVPAQLLPGTYTIGALADPQDLVLESNEANNLRPADTGSIRLGGPFWTSIGPDGGSDIRAMAIDPQTPSTLYAAQWFGGGVYRSIDGGAHWSTTNTAVSSLLIVALAVDPESPRTLYATTS